MKIKIDKKKLGLDLQYEMFCLFLHTVMITDLVRIIFGNQTIPIIFRNIVYICTMIYVVFHAYKYRHLYSIIVMSGLYVFLCLFNLFGSADLISVTVAGSAIFLSRCIAGYYFARYVPINEMFYQKLKKYYILTFVYSVLYLFFSISGLHLLNENYMIFSYNILIPTVILLLSMITKPTVFKVIASVFFTGVIIILGARGPLVCIAASVFLYLMVRLAQTTAIKRVIYCLVFGVLSVSVIVARENIFGFLVKIYPQSRTLTLMKTGEFFAASGRDSFYEIILEQLRESPLIPNGLYSDRVILFRGFGMREGITGTYAHNVILEVLFQFGVVLGGVLLIYFGWLIIRGIKKLKNDHDQNVIIFACAAITGIISLFLSGSYLTNERTWISIGILCAVVHTKSSLKKTAGI